AVDVVWPAVQEDHRLTARRTHLRVAHVQQSRLHLLDGRKGHLGPSHGAHRAAPARAASRITSVTAFGWETMIRWEPSTSTMFAPARCAMDRTMSVPAALSLVATTAHDCIDL